MPIPLIVAGGIAAAGAVGAAAISSSAQERAAENAADLAREQQSQAQAEQKRLEEKYGLTPGELAREQRLLGIPEGEEAIKFVSPGIEDKRQLELERRADLSGEELLRETGPDTTKLLDEISKRQGMTGEELFKAEGEIPSQLVEKLSGQPLDAFAPELELARQMVNAEANKRGVFGGTPEGGIRFENLGRAGVDLAIKSATERLNQQQDLVNAFMKLSTEARGEAGTVAERALSSKERASAELAQFMQDLQQQSAASKGRAASAGIGAAQITQPTVANSYDTLMGLEGYKGNIETPVQAGLSAIGQIGADYLGAQLGGITATGQDTSSLGALRESGSEYDPYATLEDITGKGAIKRRSEYSLL